MSSMRVRAHPREPKAESAASSSARRVRSCFVRAARVRGSSNGGTAAVDIVQRVTVSFADLDLTQLWGGVQDTSLKVAGPLSNAGTASTRGAETVTRHGRGT